LLLAFVFCLFAVPLTVFAQLTADDVGLGFAAETGLTTTDIRTVIGRVINAFLGLLGIVVVAIFMYAGFLYMTAGGDATKVDTAKRWMINAVIGLVIVLSAYAITAFLFQAITNSTLFGTLSGPSTPPSSLGGIRSGSSHLLGNGIIEYHYPEREQGDVPRNTNVSITFKRPLLLSSVIAGYNDNNTYDFSDDEYTDALGVTHDIESFADLADLTLVLNNSNFRVIPTDNLGQRDDFETRHPASALIDQPPAVTVVRLSQVSDVFDPQDKQTLVIDPDDFLGSSVTDVGYRVAMRGGVDGLRVWSADQGFEVGDEPLVEAAFELDGIDGGYNWSFTTGTLLDTTPPSITNIFPGTGRGEIERNILLQAYFSEPMDATTTSGRIGGGFSNIEIEGRCLAGEDCPCWIDGADCNRFEPIPGQVKLGPRYRTIEFIPDIPCDSVRVNSCGDPVYCLPKNIDLRVRVKAATLSADPPAASLPNGPLDLVGNSLDGNSNGVAEGPGASSYYRNTETGAGDTTHWDYQVGNVIDLEPPHILQTNPSSEGPGVDMGDSYPVGPSNIPADLPVSVVWSKMMSVYSVRSGGYNEAGGEEIFTSPQTTVALRAYELEKADPEQDCLALEPGQECATLPPLPPPYFFVGFGDGPVPHPSDPSVQVTEMVIDHRDFLTPNDLGFSELEIQAGFTQGIPYYQPVLGSKLKDAWQNCFYPSEKSGCTMFDGQRSCCNSTGREPFTCELGY